MRLASLIAFLLLQGCQEDRQGWSSTAWGKVQEAIDLPGGPNDARKPVAVFDFDNTLILGDIAFAAQRVQVEEHRFGFDPSAPSAAFPEDVAALFAAWNAASTPEEKSAAQARIQAAVLGRYDKVRAAEGPEGGLAYLARLLEGLTPDEARQLGRDALAREMASQVCTLSLQGDGGTTVSYPSGIRLRPPLQAMLERLEQAGFDLWVVSASPEPLVQGAAEALGIPAARVIGVRTAVVDGKLTSELEKPLPWRQGKVDAIQARIGVRPALAFGDGWTDYEMMANADRAVLLDRGTSDLKVAAINAGVAIQQAFADEPDPQKPCGG